MRDYKFDGEKFLTSKKKKKKVINWKCNFIIVLYRVFKRVIQIFVMVADKMFVCIDFSTVPCAICHHRL